MNRIVYDLSLLSQYISISSQAKEAIENANSAIKSVVSHSEWNCAERDYINQLLLKNRSDIGKLYIHITDLAQAIGDANSVFTSMENEILNMFDGVDNLIQDLLVMIGGDSNLHHAATPITIPSSGAFKAVGEFLTNMAHVSEPVTLPDLCLRGGK